MFKQLAFTALVLAGSAQAATTCGPQNFGAAAPFNLFVFGDLTHRASDVQGRIAVGRDAVLERYGVGYGCLSNPFRSSHSLVVGRDLTFHHGTVWNGTIAFGRWSDVPETVDIKTDKYGLYRVRPIAWLEAEANLVAFSSSLATLPSTGTAKREGTVLRLESDDDKLAVFSFDGLQLKDIRFVDVRVRPTATVLVRFQGAAVQLTEAGFDLHGVDPKKIVWHFPEASALNLWRVGIKGTVFAPLASLEFRDGSAQGLVLVKNFTGNGLIDSDWFAGCLPRE